MTRFSPVSAHRSWYFPHGAGTNLSLRPVVGGYFRLAQAESRSEGGAITGLGKLPAAKGAHPVHTKAPGSRGHPGDVRPAGAPGHGQRLHERRNTDGDGEHRYAARRGALCHLRGGLRERESRIPRAIDWRYIDWALAPRTPWFSRTRRPDCRRRAARASSACSSPSWPRATARRMRI